MSGIGKSIESENKAVVARDLRAGRNRCDC